MDHDEICALSLTAVSDLIRRRELSSREAVEAHLARVDEVNGTINAVCTLDPERAWAEATRADEATAAGGPLLPLHGVPMTHKDSHDVAGMRSTLGSPVFADRVPQRDAPVVAALRAAGVVTTGKTNVPELAAGSHTFNPVFGTTTNPYDPSRSAGGSSGGVAAAIAAGIQPAGDASDMGGSIRTPASFCNLVGLRPSAGRVPLGSSDPWAWISRKGPMARTVEDVRLLLEVMSTGASALVPAPARPVPAGVAAGDLRGLRVAWSPDLGLGLPVEKAVLAVAEQAAGRLAGLGAEVATAAPDLGDADEVFATTRAHDFYVGYADLHRDHHDTLKPALRWNLGLGAALTADDHRSAVLARARLRRATDAFFAHHDVLVAPAVQVQPFDARLEHPQEIEGETMHTYLEWMRMATVVSATGLPAVSVPVGFDVDGLPVGVQVVGPDGSDELLLAIAAAYQLVDPQHQHRPLLRPRL